MWTWRCRWSRTRRPGYPELRACSFDRGFHSPDNRVRLDALLDVAALPKKGRLSNADRAREEDESFAAARRVHPAIESAINGLEHRGLDRVRNHGADGFARAVALSVLAANLHRLGLLLQKRERKRRRRVASDRSGIVSKSGTVADGNITCCRRMREVSTDFPALSLSSVATSAVETQTDNRTAPGSANAARETPVQQGFLAGTN